jgi:hypothetical protein
MTSVPSSSVCELVKHKFVEDRYIPHNGEVILVRLSEDLTGPASTLPSIPDLPPRATRRISIDYARRLRLPHYSPVCFRSITSFLYTPTATLAGRSRRTGDWTSTETGLPIPVSLQVTAYRTSLKFQLVSITDLSAFLSNRTTTQNGSISSTLNTADLAAKNQSPSASLATQTWLESLANCVDQNEGSRGFFRMSTTLRCMR